MGYTKIFPIKRSFSNGSGGMIATILYNTKDKLKELDLEKVNLNDRESVKEALKVIEYVSGDKTEKEKIVFETVTSYINCSPDPYYAAKEMKQVRVRYNKDGDDIIGYHLIQSVKESPAMVDIEKFHDIGVQLATEVFDGFQVVVSTHINTDNIHNHFAINAVNMFTGKKWLDKDETKDLIRKVSDRLLKENGFEILEKTKDYKRYYSKERNEKTHLKMTDYRSTDAYEKWERNNWNTKEICKSDILALLPFVESYEELIERLIDSGYDIRYKKKSGEYLKYITFKLPFRERGIRDYQLDKNGFFLRENLTKYIRENNLKKNNELNWHEEYEKDIEAHKWKNQYYKRQDYIFKFNGKTLEDLNTKYRSITMENGNTVYRFRTEDDITLIKDIRYYHELIQNETRQYWNNKKFKREDDLEYEKYVWQDKKLKYYFECIQENIDLLEFAENENIYCVREALCSIELLYNQRKNIDNRFSAIKKLLVRNGEDVIIINQYRDILKKIENEKSNINQDSEKLQRLESLAKGYQERLLIRGFKDLEDQEKLIQNYQKYSKQFKLLMDKVQDITDKIVKYDDYMRSIYRINANTMSGNGCFEQEISRYQYIKRINNAKKKEVGVSAGMEINQKEKQEFQKEKERGR